MRNALLRTEKRATDVHRCIRSNRFIGVAVVGVSEMALALLTSMSIPPKFFTACSPRRRPALQCECRPAARVPGRRPLRFLRGGEDRAGQFRVRLGRFRRDGDIRAVTAARRAIALPIPRLAPVMNMVLPRRLGMGCSALEVRIKNRVPQELRPPCHFPTLSGSQIVAAIYRSDLG